jgi:hypothetical protein
MSRILFTTKIQPMGNSSLLPLFNEEQLKFYFITNSEGEILFSEYTDPKLKEYEKNFKSLMKDVLKKKLPVSEKILTIQIKNIYLIKRTVKGENPMTLYFVANNENIPGLEELKNKTFETYLNTFPQTFKSYSIVKHLTGSRPGEFLIKVSIENKPGFYIAKGVNLERGEHSKFENAVNN